MSSRLDGRLPMAGAIFTARKTLASVSGKASELREQNAPNATDADGVADGIGGAMKRQSLIAPINYGLA